MSEPSTELIKPRPSFFKTDAGRFALVGAGLLTLAAVFLWRDLSLSVEYIPAFLAVLFTVAAVTRKPIEEAGPVGLFGTALGAAIWYGLSLQPMLLWGVGLSCLGAMAHVAVNYRRELGAGRRNLAKVSWYTLAVSTLLGSGAFYFRFFTIGMAEASLERRVVLTLAWLLVGVVLVVIGRKRPTEPLRGSGYLFFLVAVMKAFFYDTTHLSGPLRVLVLAGAGAMVLGGAWLLSKSNHAKEVA